MKKIYLTTSWAEIDMRRADYMMRDALIIDYDGETRPTTEFRQWLNDNYISFRYLGGNLYMTILIIVNEEQELLFKLRWL